MGGQIAITVKHEEPGTRIIEGIDEVHQILHEAAGNYPSVRIQIRRPGETTQKSQWKGHLSEIFCTEKAFGVEFINPKQAGEAADACEAAERDKLEILLIVTSARKQIFLGMRFDKAKSFKGKELIFAFPEKLHRIQRRRDVRWTIPGAYEIGVVIPTPPSEETQTEPLRKSFPLVDVSRSGMSFRLDTAAEAALFRQGMTLAKIEFSLQGRPYVMDGEVVTENPISLGKRGYKIGLRFIQVDEDEAEALQDFVIVAALHLVA